MHAFQPILASTRTQRRATEPLVHNAVRFAAIRCGSAIFTGEFGQLPLNIGDAALLGAGVSCGIEPEGQVTVTTVYLDPGYAVDQFYWQQIRRR